MYIIELQNENVDNYQNIIDPDIAENIKRIGYYGLACTDDRIDENNKNLTASDNESALVYRVTNFDEVKTGEIIFFSAKNKDAANTLIRECEKRIIDMDVHRVTFRLPADIGQTEKDAMSENGYVLGEEESRFLKVTVSQLSKLSIDITKDTPDIVENIANLNLRQFQKGLERGMKKTNTLQDAVSLPILWFDRNLSVCTKIDGEVCGYLLIHVLPSGAVRPDLFYVCEPGKKQNLVDMIQLAAKNVVENLDENTMIIIPRMRDITRTLTGKVFSGIKGENIIIATKKL